MYEFLRTRVGHKLAAIVTGAWLAVLLLLIMLLGGTPETTLRYLSL